MESVQYFINIYDLLYQQVCTNCFTICTVPANVLFREIQSQTQVLALYWHQNISKQQVKGQPGPNDGLKNLLLLKVKILSTLVISLSPKSKSSVFNNARKSLSFKKLGRNIIHTSQLVSFQNSLPLAIVLQGEKTLTTWAKQMEKVFSCQSIAYFTTKESQWFCTMRRRKIAKEQHLILQHKTTTDDCWCKTCKNATLLLAAVKLNLIKLGKIELATALSKDSKELMNSCTR